MNFYKKNYETEWFLNSLPFFAARDLQRVTQYSGNQMTSLSLHWKTVNCWLAIIWVPGMANVWEN